jgi:hypothetical protein
MGLDVIVALGGLLIPPVVDFVKKKWLGGGQDTPEATMSTLATTKPEVLPTYVTAATDYLKGQVEFFNRDVIGTPSQWVVNLRAAIRPCGVILSFAVLSFMVLQSFSAETISLTDNQVDILTGIRLSCEVIITSWFGARIAISTK